MKLSKQETTLSEKDAMSEMLTTQKQLMQLYTVAIMEGGSKNLRQLFLKHSGALSEEQFSLFEEMTAKGYYEIMPAQKDAVDKKIDSFKETSKICSAQEN